MYKIYLNEELKQDSYEMLINYALSKSDAFMLVIYRYSEEKTNVPSASHKELFDSEEEYLTFLNCYEQMKEERKEKKYIFQDSTESFLKKLKPYLVKKRNFPTEWPSAKVVFYDKYTSVDICVYRSCDKVKDYLLEPKGLFNWKYPYFPDDLSFFKDGYCWFYVASHERYACIFLKYADEIKKIKEMGSNFKISECNECEENLFYEDYSK